MATAAISRARSAFAGVPTFAPVPPLPREKRIRGLRRIGRSGYTYGMASSEGHVRAVRRVRAAPAIGRDTLLNRRSPFAGPSTV